MEYMLLISGLIILLITIYDFFFTTISGSGAFFLTKFISGIAHKIILWLGKTFGRKVFSLSGLIVNLSVMTMWALLVWLGLFLVYSSDAGAITNSDGRVANIAERLYFTGYVLSTLGMGDFTPSTAFFQIATSVFSFFGFVFFTASMTYLISVSSAVIHKRSLALGIRNLGKTPEDIIKRLLETESAFSLQQIAELQNMIERHSINHQAYPVLHYYNNTDIASSLSIYITALDEAVNIILASNFNKYDKELECLHNALTSFVHHVKEKYGSSKESKIININWQSLSLPQEIGRDDLKGNKSLYERRRVFDSLLKSEGFSWNDVYRNDLIEIKKAN